MNAIIEEDGAEVVHLVGDIKTPWLGLSLSIQKHNALTGVYDNCEFYKTKTERCEELKDCIQELVNKVVLQFSRDRSLGEVSVIEPIEIRILM